MLNATLFFPTNVLYTCFLWIYTHIYFLTLSHSLSLSHSHTSSLSFTLPLSYFITLYHHPRTSLTTSLNHFSVTLFHRILKEVKASSCRHSSGNISNNLSVYNTCNFFEYWKCRKSDQAPILGARTCGQAPKIGAQP